MSRMIEAVKVYEICSQHRIPAAVSTLLYDVLCRKQRLRLGVLG